MRLLFFFLFVALVASLEDDGELSEVSKRSPINLYRAALKEDRNRAIEDAENRGIMTARQLIRGPRFLFWRFSLSTATCYSSTVTSTSTTTCTLSVSSTCAGRKKRSSSLEEVEDVITPSNVLPVESTPAADFESARQSRKAAPFYNYNPRNRLFGGIQSGMMNRYYDNYYDNYYYNNNQEDYYPYYDDYYIPPHPGRRHELFNQRRRPQLQQQQHHIPFDETDYLIDAAEGGQSEAASFKRLFNSFSSLFSTFVLTLTTTTGTSTSFTRVTVTSTPSCSTPGVFAQCPTG